MHAGPRFCSSNSSDRRSRCNRPCALPTADFSDSVRPFTTPAPVMDGASGGSSPRRGPTLHARDEGRPSSRQTVSLARVCCIDVRHPPSVDGQSECREIDRLDARAPEIVGSMHGEHTESDISAGATDSGTERASVRAHVQRSEHEGARGMARPHPEGAGGAPTGSA
ncbi:hypothetical protein AKJ09_06491 [Labilithrix luteola]|uniref:Uncharacterized protein n=1 Tax=Labilithrix luteola TaxID=1391654 RepID=A0A0K1Q271_9BACT|nr:hypothetical protein AKJ09_06491 [Labilithrix luteola]